MKTIILMVLIGYFLGFTTIIGESDLDDFLYIKSHTLERSESKRRDNRIKRKKRKIIVIEEEPKSVSFLISKYADRYKIDPDLIRIVINHESGKIHKVVSTKGAVGLMQLMPATAKHLGVNPHDLEDNIKGGVMYLSQQIREFRNIKLALAAYNAGPGNVYKYNLKVPPFRETVQYVNSICAEYACG